MVDYVRIESGPYVNENSKAVPLHVLTSALTPPSSYANNLTEFSVSNCKVLCICMS
jgi:hypothetical protein